jgi:hypothetical protein
MPNTTDQTTNQQQEADGGVAMSKQNKPKMGRRDVLRVLAAGAGAAAAGATTMATPAVASESEQEKRKARYKETDHVKAYYRVNRYPG